MAVLSNVSFISLGRPKRSQVRTLDRDNFFRASIQIKTIGWRELSPGFTHELTSMQFSDFVQSADHSAQSALTESRPLSASQSGSAIAIQDATVLIVPLCFVAIWAAVVCVISNTWKPSRKEIENSKQTAQLLCKKCAYFNNNPYIKCAANPHIAMTKAANDCCDFQPRERKTTR